MPWRLSKSDPRKVYNSRHETVCVCQNSDQADLIVRAVNALPGSVGLLLSEPEDHRLASPAKHPDVLEDTQEFIPVKPDLTALRDAAQGDGTKDASFAVSRRR